MNETQYARLMKVASLIENQAIYKDGDPTKGGGGRPNQVPAEFSSALYALYKKRALTAGDLGKIINVPQPRAKFLLGYIQRKGFARSEYSHEGRVRIYVYGRADDETGVHAVS